MRNSSRNRRSPSSGRRSRNRSTSNDSHCYIIPTTYSLFSDEISKNKKANEHAFPWWLMMSFMLCVPFSAWQKDNLTVKTATPQDSYLTMFEDQASTNFFVGKPRPMGLRWRDESSFFRPPPWDVSAAPPLVMPLVTERPPTTTLGGHSTTPLGGVAPQQNQRMAGEQVAHSSNQDPNLEDLDLIDVLWRNDIASEKHRAQMAPAEQYEQDLQLLTEKSIRMTLTPEESSRYESLAKGYFEDFYNPPNYRVNKEVSDYEESFKRDISTPTDDDLDALLEDVSKENGRLNQLTDDDLTDSPTNNGGVLRNVSLSSGIVYDQSNLTDLHFAREVEKEGDKSAGFTSDLYNGTALEVHPWIQQAEMTPNDVFPTASHMAYPAFPQNETRVEAVSDGSHYDHAYQAQMNTSPDSNLYNPNPYYDGRSVSFSNDSSSVCSSSSPPSTNYGSETENFAPTSSRYFGKLAPHQETTIEQALDTKPSPPTPAPHPLSANLPRRRGRQSKDEQLAASHQLPVTAQQIADMSLSELQKLLKNERLSEMQKALIKKIRRRGKNKVAARTCRMRRGGERGVHTSSSTRTQQQQQHWSHATYQRQVPSHAITFQP